MDVAKPKNLAVLQAMNEAMWKEELEYQRRSVQEFNNDLAAQHQDISASPKVSLGSQQRKRMNEWSRLEISPIRLKSHTR